MILRVKMCEVIVLAKDPVCGMEVDEKTAKYKSEYMGKVYYFCSEHCKMIFDKETEKYEKAFGYGCHGCHGCGI